MSVIGIIFFCTINSNSCLCRTCSAGGGGQKVVRGGEVGGEKPKALLGEEGGEKNMGYA